MPSQAEQHIASSARGRPNLSWWLATVLLSCVIVFMVAGEYRAQSISPSHDILYDSMLRSMPSRSLISRSIAPEAQPSTEKDVCNTVSQRLGHELQALLWTMTVDRTVIAPEAVAPITDDTSLGAGPEDEDALPDFSSVDPAWKPLIARLGRDGFKERDLLPIYAALGPKSYSPAYMAAKIHELYGVQGIGIKRNSTAAPLLPDNYRQPISDATAGSCVAFMKKHSTVLKDIEKRHGVPANVIVGLLLIETGLGRDLGSHSALRALSSMALTNTPTMLASQGNSRQPKYLRAGSLNATLRDKSNWAYKEVRALIRYSKQNKLDIATIPGSIYGAIGICQFMPSNILPYAKDGNKDGKVDIFNVVDAMYSVANYLEANGWRSARSDAAKHAVIKTYNKDNSYAASVLATSRQLTLAQQGKISSKRNALAGVVVRPRASQGYIDPCLKNLKPVPETAKVQGLGSYMR